VDPLGEEQRLVKEDEAIRERIAQLEARLRDDAFLTKAPAQVVERERKKLAVLEDRLKRLHQELSQLS
jgi:valyl-tRNA synthetase